MRVPSSLAPLVDMGVIEEVVRPLMSGKEADVFVVVSRGELRVAKVYKEAQNRSFKHRSDYTEGRKVRNGRRQRAMDKRSKYGKAQLEEAWRSAEVDVIYRLQAAGVRVPVPYDFIEGVLVMEMVTGFDGQPAKRLVDMDLTRREARWVFDVVLQEVIKMLCAGVVHGDLSDFNILMDGEGPVIIDFPQAVDPAANRNARRLLVRDVNNLTSFLERFDRSLRGTRFGEEMWDLYEQSQLRPDTQLTGKYKPRKKKSDTYALLREIEEVQRFADARREAAGLPPRQRTHIAVPSAEERERERKRREQEERRAKALASGPARGEGRGKRRRKRRKGAHRAEGSRAEGGRSGPRGERRREGRRGEARRRASSSPSREAADPFADLDSLLLEG